MKINTDELIKMAPQWFNEISQTMLKNLNLFEEVKEDRVLDLKLIINGKEYEPEYLIKLITEIEAYVDLRARDKFAKRYIWEIQDVLTKCNENLDRIEKNYEL